MIDIFNPLHSIDFGTLAIDHAHDASVVGPDSPPRPQRFDVASPTLPPRLSIDIGVFVSGPNLPNPPQLLTDFSVWLTGPTAPNPPRIDIDIDVYVSGPTIPPQPK